MKRSKSTALTSKDVRRAAGLVFNQHLSQTRSILGNILICDSASDESDLFAVRHLLSNIVKKSVHFYDGIAYSDSMLTDITIAKWLRRERLNAFVNANQCFTDVSPQLARAKEIVHELLAAPPSLGLGSFGNGASYALKRTQSSSEEKYLHGKTVTKNCLAHATACVEASPYWAEIFYSGDPAMCFGSDGRHRLPATSFTVVPGSRLAVVPKDRRSHRPIVIAPELNGFCQKAIGDALRVRLRSHNLPYSRVDLNRSGAVNKMLAREGSIHGKFATIDAKEASDSITRALVEYLLPEAWLEVLAACREEYVRLPDGRWHRLAMWAGMGNGYTFELESIIFWAIGVACSEGSSLPFAELSVSIHGDDLILPSDVADVCRKVFMEVGIVVNDEKSYSSGPFRESCGGDYYHGVDVTPFYVKEQRDRVGDLFWLANSLQIWYAARTRDFQERYPVFRKVFLRLAQKASKLSGFKKLLLVPPSMSRRSGFFSYAPPLGAGATSWTIPHIYDQPKKKRELPQLGSYLTALNRMDRLSGGTPDNPYSNRMIETTVEVVRWSRQSWWDDSTTNCCVPVVWYVANGLA